MIIGLTGKYCAGKNYIAGLFEKQGCSVIDVDKLGYDVLETEKEAVFSRFGRTLQKPNGTLDRRALGKIVFSNPAELAALEAIVHPPVDNMIDNWLKNTQPKNGIFVINAAVLHRAGVFNQLKCIILVSAPTITRFCRAKRRDKLPWKILLNRFKAQKNFHSQYFAGNAEIHRVDNSGFFRIENRISKILEKLPGE